MQRRPQTAESSQLRVTSAMLRTVHKKFGFTPSEILKNSRIDVGTLVSDGTLAEEHTKLFQRVDALVEV